MRTQLRSGTSLNAPITDPHRCGTISADWIESKHASPALLMHVCSSLGPSVSVVTDAPAVLFHHSSVCCRGDVGLVTLLSFTTRKHEHKNGSRELSSRLLGAKSVSCDGNISCTWRGLI